MSKDDIASHSPGSNRDSMLSGSAPSAMTWRAPPPDEQQATWRRQAQYLTTINLSAAPQWSYALKTLARPTGRATQVIYTEYDLPQRTRQPHDVIVDSQGTAWYASFGEQILGKLDPKTGKATEYQIPRLKANLPTGILALRFGPAAQAATRDAVARDSIEV